MLVFDQLVKFKVALQQHSIFMKDRRRYTNLLSKVNILQFAVHYADEYLEHRHIHAT